MTKDVHLKEWLACMLNTSTTMIILTEPFLKKIMQLLSYSLFGSEFGNLKWNFHVLFPVYFIVNYWNKMEFYVKFVIFSILKWNFQNINIVIVGL